MSVNENTTGVAWRLMDVTGFGAYADDSCRAERVFGCGYTQVNLTLIQFAQDGCVS